MPRKKRVWYPGAIYHLMSRGNRKSIIFADRSDYCFFLEMIRKVQKIYPFTVHSICLMTNHFHILMESKNVDPGRILQKILGVYAQDFNHRHLCTGHLFESRYTSCIVENDIYFLEVSRYIHLNPVKAGMVRDPSDYEYSSYNLFVPGRAAGRESPSQALIREIVDTSRTLDLFDGNKSRRYKAFVEDKTSHEEQELLIRQQMREEE